MSSPSSPIFAGRSRPARPPGPPRGFQRRLVVIMLAAGLVPAVSLEAARRYVLATVPEVSFEPIRATLERAEQGLESAGPHPDLAQEMREVQRDLVQAELARPHLPSLIASSALPWVIGAELALIAVAVTLARRLGRPIADLTEGMARLGRGDLQTRIVVPPGPDDELAYLVRRFNAMADELEAQRIRLQTSEKLGAWQDVARGMAHDLKNPLTAMRMALGRLARVAGRADPDRASDPKGALAESLELLEEEVAVLQRMTESFSTFARLPEPHLAPLDLAALVADVAALYGDHPSGTGVQVVPGPTVMVAADADQLRRVLGNLVKNAVEATQTAAAARATAAGALTPVEIVFGQEAARAVVRVRDRGAGVDGPIEGAALAKGLGSSKKGGSGLGLPVATKIVHDHGGTLRLLPRAGGGAEAVVELPLA